MVTRSAAIFALAFAIGSVAPVRASEGGTTRADVRRVQENLRDLGYPAGTPDGRLGPQTRTAIKNFQRDRNLNATGDLNDETRSALDTAIEQRGGSDIASGDATTGPVTAATVRRVQGQLDKLGYPVGRINGDLGPETRTAIRNFQRDKGLNATGELDAQTRAALETNGSATSGVRGSEPR